MSRRAASLVAVASLLAAATVSGTTVGPNSERSDARACRARDRRRHDRPRERRPCASPPDRLAGARHRRVLLAGRRPRAPEPPPDRCGRDARGRSAPRSGRPVRQAAPYVLRGGHNLNLELVRRAPPPCGLRRRSRRYAARLLAAGSPRAGAPRPVGSVPAGGVGPALARDDRSGTVPRSSQPRPVAGGRCDPSYPRSASRLRRRTSTAPTSRTELPRTAARPPPLRRGRGRPRLRTLIGRVGVRLQLLDPGLPLGRHVGRPLDAPVLRAPCGRRAPPDGAPCAP